MTQTTNGQNNYNCSFCGKVQGQVRRLIAGPERVFICNECVDLCAQIIAEENPPTPSETKNLIDKGINPKWIHEKLDEYVIGQDQAKKVLSVAVYNHYKRIWSNQKSSEVELQKANILLLGPAGSGKTLLAQTLAKILEVPFAIADATSLTEAGYVGEDVENILLRLIQAADHDISKAEQGIIYIDEIDKISRKSPNPSITRDVSGEGVQQSLLKIIEGCLANVPPQGGRKHPNQEFLQIRTDNILFMCGGAFEGLGDMIQWRISKDKATMGFQAGMDSKSDSKLNDEIFELVSSEDLLKYGFIPELIGRLPVTVNLRALDKNGMIRVLKEPKNSLVKQYEHLFKMDNVDLVFTNEALETAAEEALKQGTGARGLRSILENALVDVMYDLPSLNGIVKCSVNSKAILGKEKVSLVNETGEITKMRPSEQKSA